MVIEHVSSSAMPTDRSAIEREAFTATVGRFDVPPGPPGGSHHHGDHHVIAYLISGKVRIEWCAEGTSRSRPPANSYTSSRERFIERPTRAKSRLSAGADLSGRSHAPLGLDSARVDR
jgi:hypothetical protein